MSASLVGSEMCIRDSAGGTTTHATAEGSRTNTSTRGCTGPAQRAAPPGVAAKPTSDEVVEPRLARAG
eukprot:1933579-Alexandrium_andersonii.AAC.1